MVICVSGVAITANYEIGEQKEMIIKIMTIKEWFKSGVQYDSEGTQIWAIEKTNDADYLHHVADVRGWGELQNLFKLDIDKAAEFQDKVGKFIAEAINEKLERDGSNLYMKNIALS